MVCILYILSHEWKDACCQLLKCRPIQVGNKTYPLWVGETHRSVYWAFSPWLRQLRKGYCLYIPGVDKPWHLLLVAHHLSRRLLPGRKVKMGEKLPSPDHVVETTKEKKTTQQLKPHDYKTPSSLKQQPTGNKDKTKTKPGVQNQPNAHLISLTMAVPLTKAGWTQSAAGTCGRTSPSPRQKQQGASWDDLMEQGCSVFLSMIWLYTGNCGICLEAI